MDKDIVRSNSKTIRIKQKCLVAILLMVVTGLDFEPLVSQYGSVVNTRLPAKFQAHRKNETQNVVIQDATAANVAVTLNQHVHTSFYIGDLDSSLALKNLITEFLIPAMVAQASFIDSACLGQSPQFLGNAFGGMGTLSTSNVKGGILGVRQSLNTQLAPPSGRSMIWTPSSETTALQADGVNNIFIEAQKVGDGGEAMREAELGRKLNFNHYMCQNAVGTSVATDHVTGAVNHSAGYNPGATAITVNGLSAPIADGTWVTFGGDMIPQQVVSTTGGSTPTVITIANGLTYGIANSAVVTLYTPAETTTSYAIGYVGDISISGLTTFPTKGQLVSFGTTPTVIPAYNPLSNAAPTNLPFYTIIQANSVAGTITLDRPLEQTLGSSAAVNVGPPGQMNLAFLRNCMGMVVRPLALPPEPTGVRGSVVNYNGLSMRAVLTYQGLSQQTLITLDMIFGLKVFRTDLAALLLG